MNVAIHVHLQRRGHCNRSDQFQESAPVKWDGGGGGGRLFLHEFYRNLKGNLVIYTVAIYNGGWDDPVPF